MKSKNRYLLYLLCTLLTLTSSSLIAQKYDAIKIPANVALPVLDGVLDDSIWTLAQEDSLLFGDYNQWGTVWTDYENNIVTWRAVWSDSANKLYVAVKIVDDIRGTFDNNDPDKKPYRPWDDESLEFYTDGNCSGGDYLGRYDIAQQWRVSGENNRNLNFYPSPLKTDFYNGPDFLTAIQIGAAGNWTCEAEFTIYDNCPDTLKTLTVGDSIGWEIRYTDSDDKTWQSSTAYGVDHFVGWIYSGQAARNADYFGRLILGEAPIFNSIQIITPALNDTWYIGQNAKIIWNSTGDIKRVTLEISRNSGNTWLPLRRNVLNSGSYEWNVTGPVSEKCQIKISDSKDPAVFSISPIFQIEIEPRVTLLEPIGGERWFIHEKQAIRWSIQGNIDSLSIQLSNNMSFQWNEIARVSAASGSYLWEISGTPATTYRIKLIDLQNPSISDISPADFTIANQQIEILSPNQNSVWYLKSTGTILWQTEGSINAVNIELSRNDGSSWQPLIKNSENDGAHTWEVTGNSSENCLIRISDTNHSEIFAVSAPFAIRNTKILVKSPNGREEWLIGSLQMIQWDASDNVTAIQAELSRNAGASWEIVQAEISEKEFEIIVTGPPSDSCLFRVTDLKNPAITDISDTLFSIIEPKTLTLLYPVGNEQWAIGSHQNIRWQATGKIQTVEIRLSREGVAWNTIAEITDSTSFSWQVQAPVSDNCFLEIRDKNEPAISGKSKQFAIFEGRSISVISPNGGEAWQIGTTAAIEWGTTGQIDSVRIELSRDNGNLWEAVAETSQVTTYQFPVSAPPSSNCLIRVSAAQFPQFADQSDAVFAIDEPLSLTLLSPVGGENWALAGRQEIRWESTGQIPTVEIRLSTDTGVSWRLITHTNNTHSYSWQVQSTVSDACIIELRAQNDTLVTSRSERFSIYEDRSIAVVTPNGGEKWLIGSTHTVEWTSTGSLAAAQIDLSRDSGDTWETLTDSTTEKIFNWQVTGLWSENCLVRVAAVGEPAIADSSDDFFSIQELPGLTLINPTQDSRWARNSVQQISWESTGNIDSVEIRISIDSGNIWQSINRVENSGSYSWTVASLPADNCVIELRALADSTIFDRSELFSIYEGKSISVLYPNGGEIWNVGSSQSIAWSSTGAVEAVKIQISRDNGLTWETITNETQEKSFNWTVSGSPSANCYIQISAVNSPEIIDQSDLVFTIDAPTAIQLLNPQAGDEWAVGSSQNITWHSAGSIPMVELLISTNAGLAWELIDTIENSHDYVWTVTGFISEQCVIQVRDKDDSTVFGQSEQFTIFEGKSISIIYPNGGEIWDVGTSQHVKWKSTGSIETVKIELSRNNSANWELIANVAADAESFQWDVAGSPSSSCKIRITDTANSNFSDVSENIFLIVNFPSIQVLYPDGYETWIIGAKHKIRWSASQSIEKVKIELSRDHQSTWATIVEETENDGAYEWLVTPSAALTSCYIRISNIATANVFDESDHVFSIIETTGHPTIIVSAPENEAALQIGTVQMIQWKIMGSVILLKIELARDGGNSWHELTTTSANTQKWSWTVTPPTSNSCRIRISDISSPAIASSGDFQITPIFVTGLTNPNSQPFGDAQQAYRFISMPLQPSFPSADSILLDDLGAYDKLTWRLFDLQNSQYQEYPATNDFMPGKSKLMIVRDPYKIIDTGPGHLIQEEQFIIPLDSGWNFIANPFLEQYTGNLTQANLELRGSSDAITLFHYEGAWSITQNFKTWTGYALKTTTACDLVVSPGWSVPKTSPPFFTDPAGWQIQIIAKCEAAVDSVNFVGVSPEALPGWDPQDIYEPPPIGKYVSLFFPRHNWPEKPDKYTVEMQPEQETGNSWNFSVTTNISPAHVTLQFRGIEQLDGGRKISLLDLGSQTYQNIQEKPEYSYYVEAAKNTHLFRLLIGGAEFIEDENQEFSQLPGKFQLFQNYPNPFNSETQIRFVLPDAGKINVTVYNILGEKVNQLWQDQSCEAGFYTIRWNGKNDLGEDLASGIFLCSVQYKSGISIIRKMVLVR